MLHVCCLFWDANGHSQFFSRCYSEEWVIRLYCGFKRHLTVPFRFICFTERDRNFEGFPIEQERIRAKNPTYAACIEPFRLGEPMILVGLDTLITGNIDHLAEYCTREKRTADEWRMIALPRDPYDSQKECNGVVLAPAGKRAVYTAHRGENDMDWLNMHPHIVIDDEWPGHVKSFKGSVRDSGLGDARIVYFHGVPKMHELGEHPLIIGHWHR